MTTTPTGLSCVRAASARRSPAATRPTDRASGGFAGRSESFVQPVDERVLVAARESQTLAELRDTLLPKLISGEIRIRDAEHEVADAT